MDPEEKNISVESLELLKENNKILKKLHRSMKMSRAIKAIYWVIIIGSMLGVYYYFQPFIDNLTGTFDGVTSLIGKGQNAVDSIHDVGSLLNR